MSARKPEIKEKPQYERFIKAARQLDADEDEAVFKAKMALIAQ